MKKILLIIILCFLSIMSYSQLIPQDKQTHFVVGTSIGFTASCFTINKPPINSLCWSIGSSSVIASSKELYDKYHHGNPELNDILFTVGGSIAGWGIIQLFKITKKPKSNKQYTGMVIKLGC